MGVFLSIAGNSLGLYLASRWVENFFFSGGYVSYLTAGLFLAFLNFTLKPILKMASGPVILLTLGLFIIVINAFLLWITDRVFDFMAVETAAALILTAILVGFINLLISAIHKITD